MINFCVLNVFNMIILSLLYVYNGRIFIIIVLDVVIYMVIFEFYMVIVIYF